MYLLVLFMYAYMLDAHPGPPYELGDDNFVSKFGPVWWVVAVREGGVRAGVQWRPPSYIR